jgi:hypothetical protein
MRDRDMNEDPTPSSDSEPAPIDPTELLVIARVAKQPPPTDDPPAPPPPTPGDKGM